MAINDDDNLDELQGTDGEAVPFDLSQLPASFQAFLAANDIDPQIYTQVRLPRYIRWNTHIPLAQLPSVDDLKKQLNTDNVWQVQGLAGFFGVGPTPTRLVDIAAYKDKKVFGIDLSSAVAVDALQIGANDHVLDLCCAPGAKLCMMANLIGNDGTGTATGVDIAAHRLATCRALVRKYKIGERVRLFQADGTKFDTTPPARLGATILSQTKDNTDTDAAEPPRKRSKKSKESAKDDMTKPFWASRLLRSAPHDPMRLYDKVLVDAECTHDGSISHILKYEQWGWDAFESNFMDETRLATICQLQRDLMAQGWEMLCDDGIMVYSTCSLTIKQNEENVAWFLQAYPDARLEPVPLASELGIQLAKIKHVDAPDNVQKDMDDHCVRRHKSILLIKTHSFMTSASS
ncbi:S-adenosyl-L-methionine-dependent methyltransferase [Gongronella butleri]|nr:S-adenosyl-L-methionine-dependent methyltransferase [Gongronella butleri]